MQARERLERVSVERCVSGLALPGIYAFLAQRSPQVRYLKCVRAYVQRLEGCVEGFRRHATFFM